jgi:hypothetical protein
MIGEQALLLRIVEVSKVNALQVARNRPVVIFGAFESS